jgi:hypothetical protein
MKKKETFDAAPQAMVSVRGAVKTNERVIFFEIFSPRVCKTANSSAHTTEEGKKEQA